MSLTVFLRKGTWYVRGTAGPPDARTPVYRSTGLPAGERARAEAFAENVARQIWDEAVFGKRVIVTYADAARSYGEKTELGKRDATAVRRLAEYFGAKRLSEVMAEGGQAQLDEAIEALCPKGSPGTKIRSVIIPHTAILNHAAKRGWCAKPAFDRPRQPKGRTDWLHPHEAVRLIEAAPPHLRTIIEVSIGCGARVGELLGTPWSDVDLVAGTIAFWPDRTKAEKRRIAKLSPRALVALANLPHREGAVFRRPGTKLKPLGEAYKAKDGEGGQFKTAWRQACIRAGLAKEIEGKDGQPRLVARLSPHAMRHTWATYFQAATKDPIRLRDEGGWSTLALVERYAHRMQEADVPLIASVWGVAHPDLFPAARRAQVVQDLSPKPQVFAVEK